MTTATPLAWPEGWPRTPDHEKDGGWKFKQQKWETGSFGSYTRRVPVTFAKARDLLFEELKKLGATSPVVSTNHPTDRFNLPVESKRRVTDEGVAVYFQYRDRPMVMACDRYETAAANMRSLGLAIEALRQLERHGGGTMMERAFAGLLCASTTALLLGYSRHREAWDQRRKNPLGMAREDRCRAP
jgi:hypothetical protein